jgi:uncharacterized protein (TIGR00730 family)
MKVTVFGGAHPKNGEPAYKEAYDLGRLLGKSGYTVLTGGYIGTMEAVSKGVNETGGHVIGVTCDEIEKWRSIKKNAWVQEELHYSTLRERLYTLLEQCDAAIALPGGVGTLAEICLLWNHLIIAAFPPKPLIVIGGAWKKVIKEFLGEFEGYVNMRDQDLIQFAPDNQAAISLLKESLESRS